ncbi:MAG: ribonuclease III [Thermodesulfobacteriota bacterium]|nr:ribonuclease III [Thermodesulfobacteriota bacterium]
MDKARIKKLKKFQSAFSYKFRDLNLLNHAFTHRSYVNEKKDESIQDNERLELLGDAVLDVVITHLLMARFPQYTEGDLSKARASIVNEQRLSAVAKEMRLGDYLLLSKGEEQTNGREKDSILAATFEAIVASMYLDRGFKKVFRVIERKFSRILSEEDKDFYKDFKTRLQEYSQRILKKTPQYIHTGESGPDHDKTFHVDISIKGIILGKGSGKSKKGAEQEAAKEALEALVKAEKMK